MYGIILTGGHVYIPSARLPPCVDLDEEMVDGMSGFAIFLQAGMDRVNYERSNSVGQEPPPKNIPPPLPIIHFLLKITYMYKLFDR